MKKTLILAGLTCGWLVGIVGCDATSSSATSSSASSVMAGRAAVDSGSVTATDADGDTIAKAKIGKGEFRFHLPDGVKFPLVLIVDSAGDTLRTFVPASDSLRRNVRIDRLTDSACKKLGGDRHPPRTIDTAAWHRQIDSLRPLLDSLLRADSLVRPPHRVRDSILPPPDSLRPPRHPGDTARPADSLRPPKDSLRLPPVPCDSLRKPPMSSGSPKWHPMMDSLGAPKPAVPDSI